jgi:hypothetical protein
LILASASQSPRLGEIFVSSLRSFRAADLDRLSPPDPYRSGRMPWVRQFNRIFLEETGSLERIYFTAPFSDAVNIRGYENLVLDLDFEIPRRESFAEFKRIKIRA